MCVCVVDCSMSYLADQHHSHRTEQASHTAVCHSDSTWLPPGTLLTITIILRSVNSIVCDEMIIHLSARCISAVRLSVCLSSCAAVHQSTMSSVP